MEEVRRRRWWQRLCTNQGRPCVRQLKERTTRALADRGKPTGSMAEQGRAEAMEGEADQLRRRTTDLRRGAAEEWQRGVLAKKKRVFEGIEASNQRGFDLSNEI